MATKKVMATRTKPRSSLVAAGRGASAMATKTKPRSSLVAAGRGASAMATRTKGPVNSLSTERLSKPMQSMDVKKNLKPKRPTVSQKAAKMIGKNLKGMGYAGTALALGQAALNGIRSLEEGKKSGTPNSFSPKGRTKK